MPLENVVSSKINKRFQPADYWEEQLVLAEDPIWVEGKEKAMEDMWRVYSHIQLALGVNS